MLRGEWSSDVCSSDLNDRNRYWGVSPWGHFGFSHFADGRRYAEFLTTRLTAEPKAGLVVISEQSPSGAVRTPRPTQKELDLESLGRIAQDALYFHEGPTAPIPQDQARYAHQMAVPAGIRKS